MKANEQCRWRETENEDWELVHGTQVIGKVMLCQEADDPDGCFYTAWVAPPAGERTSLVGMMDVTAKFIEEEGDEEDPFGQAAEWVMEEVEKRHGLKSPASQKRAAEAAKVAAGGSSTTQARFTPRGGDDSSIAASSKNDQSGGYGYGYGNAPTSTGSDNRVKGGGDVRGGGGYVRTQTESERRAQSSGRGTDRPSATAKATAEKPAEPTISPEEQEQQRIAAEIRAKRRRVAGYRSLLSPARNDNLSSTLGGGGSV